MESPEASGGIAGLRRAAYSRRQRNPHGGSSSLGAAARPQGHHLRSRRHPGRQHARHPRRRGRLPGRAQPPAARRSEEHTSELQSLMRLSYAVFCLKNKKNSYTDINKPIMKHKNRRNQNQEANEEQKIETLNVYNEVIVAHIISNH